ncbi:MAG: AAA family ATPase [Methylobacter sp.]|nr:AAA family ATPase [Methylobacter sp.]
MKTREPHTGILELIDINLGERLTEYLDFMQQAGQLCTRFFTKDHVETLGYYSKTLFYDETAVASILRSMKGPVASDPERIAQWVTAYCRKQHIALSDKQAEAVNGIVQQRFSILTGGPGCGKTTTTLVIVRLLEAMNKTVLLAAPTGRASQRMSEVIGREAKTLHRLLAWQGGEFQRNAASPLTTDFLMVDECSMLDISLTASLLKALPPDCQVLFIGDPDQLPAVGAGNVLKDMMASEVIPCFRLTQVFRQAQASLIIRYAHQINQGQTPAIESPFKHPELWKQHADCLFIDSDEATQAQLAFITRVKRHFNWKTQELEKLVADQGAQSPFEYRIEEAIQSAYDVDFVIPDHFSHVDIAQLTQTEAQVDALKAVVKNIHPWSSLHYGLSAVDTVVKLYLEWIPSYHGQETEIQILTPMTRGSLGSAHLNQVIQAKANPPAENKRQLTVGERLFREGDRVIHRRNNYDLNVFNGDIGKIVTLDTEELTATVTFYPDHREVHYKKEAIMELDLAYAITIHKSQGSEFKAVIIPILTQHFKMLYRNLVYTGLTRAKTLAVFVGTRKALAMASRQQDVSQRQTALEALLKA